MSSSEDGADLDGDRVGALLAELRSADTRFHGWTPDVEANWGLTEDALAFLVDVVGRDHRTLETGVGYSTVLFAVRGAHHTVVSPFEFEHDRVRAWCEEHDVDLSRVSFVAQASQQALPELEATPLDLVLIDGDHAFPTPFIDFYYAARRLVPGGLLVLDDTHVRSCALLAEFLRADTPRWRVHTEMWTTNVYERLDGPLQPIDGWAAQPWGATTLRSGTPMTLQQRVRARLRLRSRFARGGERASG